MKKFVLYIVLGFGCLFFSSCSTPQPGSYEWSKKYSNSGIAKNRSASCGVKKSKRPKGMEVKYTSIKKSNKKKK
ncbi:MAG: hypothetical protein WC011_02685 [Candidatus Paceibacterota bacterium]